MPTPPPMHDSPSDCATRESGGHRPGAPVEAQKQKMDPGLIAALSVGAAGVGGMIGGILSAF